VKPGGGALLLGAVTVVVAAAVVSGFLLLGSPQDERLRRLDSRRLADLRAIATSVQSAYRERRENGTPDSSEVLAVPAYHGPDHRDPVTGEAYGYRVTGPGRLELCATFQTEVRDADLETWERGWGHPVGRACFELDLANGNPNTTPIVPSTSRASPPTPPSGAR